MHWFRLQHLDWKLTWTYVRFERRNTKFKVNTKRTIFELKDGSLKIAIHKIIGVGDDWFLSCRWVGIEDYCLDTEDFEEAVKRAQKVISEKVSSIVKESDKFCNDKEIEIDKY